MALLLHKLLRMGALSGGWHDVTPPTGWLWTLPFTIQQNGRSFQPAPSFNLETYSGIANTATYYVDKTTGNNANTGADWANALADVVTAAGKADVDRIYFRGGKYHYKEVFPVAFWAARNIKFIAADNDSWWTPDMRGYFDNNYSLVGSHYVGTFNSSTYFASVTDWTNLDVNGYPTELTLKASEAEVDAAANSFYLVYGATSTLYIHTFDNRAPDANISYNYNLTLTKNSRTYYFENNNFYRGFIPTVESAVGELKCYFKDCNFLYGPTEIYGLPECIFQGCQFKGTTDAISLKISSTLIPKVIAIDCDAMNISNGATDQGSTTHNSSTIVWINGTIHDVGGQCVADTGAGALSWMLGTRAYNSRTSGVGYYTEGTMWLDCCTTAGGIGTYDIENTLGATTYIRNFVGSKGTNGIAGTLTAY